MNAFPRAPGDRLAGLRPFLAAAVTASLTVLAVQSLVLDQRAWQGDPPTLAPVQADAWVLWAAPDGRPVRTTVVEADAPRATAL